MTEEDRITILARMSDAMAHPARIRMFRYILKRNTERRPVRNKDLVADFEYAQATISQHMSKLIIADLIETRQDGTSTLYYANIGAVRKFVDMIQDFN